MNVNKLPLFYLSVKYASPDSCLCFMKHVNLYVRSIGEFRVTVTLSHK